MARKNIIEQYNMFSGQTINMSSNLTSNITNLHNMDKASIHLSWTAGPVGEFKLFARNGNLAGQVPPWYELAFSALLTITGSDSELQIVLNECPFSEIQLRYTASSGSATDLKAVLTAKTVGA